MEKNVFLKSRFRNWPLHTLYSELVSNPPSGFKIEYQKAEIKTPSIYNLDNKAINPRIKEIIFQCKSIPYILIQKLQQQQFYDYDLVYASQHVLFNSNSKWITDLEFANALTGYGNIRLVKNIIKKQLESKNCKAILPWSEWSKRTLIKSINCKNFKEKIEVIPYTITPKKIHQTKHNGINFLFVGSKNLLNNRNIQFKNLKEVIIAFNEISNKYEDVYLTIRSSVTTELKSLILKNPKIKLFELNLAENELHRVYLEADIFVLPSYETNGMALLEAMSFGLPVIAMRIYDIPELITHMKNGILIEPPKNMKCYTNTESPYDYSMRFYRDMSKNSEGVVKQLKESFCFLIENNNFMKKMGNQAKNTIENGVFSIKYRNERLKKVFENALK